MKFKKLIPFVYILLFTACTNPSTGSTPSNSPSHTAAPTQAEILKISDYYHFIADRAMKYAGIGNEYAQMDVYVDYIKGDRIQLRTVNPGTTTAQVIELKDGELKKIITEGEFYFRDDLTSKENQNPEIIIKEPLIIGTSWTTNDGYRKYISGINKPINTPSGNYEALEITTEAAEYTLKEYYVRNIGFVKSVFTAGSSQIETSLEKIGKNVPVMQTIKFYYPDFNKDQYACINQVVELKTNDNPKEIFEKFFKTSPKPGISKIMSSNTKINSLYMNISQNKAYIDFSKEFISEMNAGTHLESMLLQSTANAVGNYFNTDSVQITIGGKPYESGHILLKAGEPLYTDYKNTYEIK